MEETTREAVEKLLRLCEEALRRVEEEPDEDFTIGLDVLQDEFDWCHDRLQGRLSRNLPGKKGVRVFFIEEYHECVFLQNTRGYRTISFRDPMAPLKKGIRQFQIFTQSDGYASRRWWHESANFNNSPIQGREEIKASVVVCFSRWVRFLNEELEKLGTASLAPAPEAPQEAEQLSETDLLKLHFPTSKGQQKAIKVLELMRKGFVQKDIIPRVGLSKGTVSGYMTKLRKLFPDLSPSLQSSETVRKTPRR